MVTLISRSVGCSITLKLQVHECIYPLGGDRDVLNRPDHCSFSVQDVTEDSKTVGDPCESEDGEYESTSLSEPSDDHPMEKVEAAEGKQEATVAQPQRRASTPPPPNLPVKILTRLGSLDGEFPGVTLM